MKIAITVSSIKSGGGLSKYIYTIANLLSESGHRIHVITTHGSDEENTANAQHLREQVMLHSCASRNLLLRYWKTWIKLKEIRPDIIINNYNGVVQYLLPLLSKQTKLIHVIHGDTVDFYRIAAINAQRVAAWIAPSPAVAHRFNEYTKNRFKELVHVIPHGVSENSFLQTKSSSIPELTFVGVLYEHKGAHFLPKIIQKLQERKLNFHFNIVGDGVLRERMEASLQNEIKQGIVRFTGVIPPNGVYQILATTSIFVYPTQLDSFGLVIAEAMMSGAVPVVSLLKGITDSIIHDGLNGYLIPIGNVDSFVDRIAKLIDDNSVLTRMRNNAMDAARKRFSLSAMQTNYSNFINNL